MGSREGSNVAPTRRTAIVTGVLFIIATLAAILAAALVPDLTETDYLTRISAHANQVAAGAFFYVVAALGSAAIAVSLYRVLKETNAGLALGSVVFRALEAAMYMVAVVSLLTLATIGQRSATAGPADRPSLQAMGDSLVSARDHAGLLGVFAFCLGALIYYSLFWRSRLIPRWLAGWGIVAIILLAVAAVSALFSDTPVTSYVLLALPIGLQEMVLAVWLIVKGFNTSALTSTRSA